MHGGEILEFRIGLSLLCIWNVLLIYAGARVYLCIFTFNQIVIDVLQAYFGIFFYIFHMMSTTT